MQIQRIDPSDTEIKLTITATAAELKPIKDSVVKRLSKDIKLPGFRDGKAPQAMVEKSIDQNLLQGDFLDEAMTQLYAAATTKEDIRPVTRPEVTVKKFVPFTELEFEVKTNIIGAIKLPNYKKPTAKKQAVTVTAKDVEGVVESLQLRVSDKKEAARALKAGDEAIIDFKGVDAKKEPIQGADGKDYPLNIGSNTFIPGFEDNLIGMKPGEEKSFTLTFPKEYGVQALATKKVTFTVKVNKVNEVVKPKADDAFAAKVGPFKTLADLKEDIKKQLMVEKEREAEAAYQNEVVGAITSKSTVKIPQPLIEQQVDFNINQMRQNLMYRGQTFEEFLKSEAKTEDEYRKSLTPQAEEQIKTSLVLAEIAQLENLAVTPEELDMRVQLLKGQYQDEAMQAELDKPENRQDIASRMLNEKVLAIVTASSN